MNIKEAERLSGVTKPNIRFYEKEGLLHPRRTPNNDYREYSREDIRSLKMIRALRMLDMPLDEIRQVLQGQLTLAEAAARQQVRLQKQAEALAGAIRLCGELAGQAAPVEPDALLARMEEPCAGFFAQWAEDYRRLAAAEHERTFTFFPDEPIRTPQEFSSALFAYADAQGLTLVITQESMYPVFTIDGVEYTATRQYTSVRGFPVASVHCEALRPEALSPGMPPLRRRALRLLHHGWPAVLIIACFLPVLWRSPGGLGWLFATWQGWLVLLAAAMMLGVSLYRGWLFTYNENGKKRPPR